MPTAADGGNNGQPGSVEAVMGRRALCASAATVLLGLAAGGCAGSGEAECAYVVRYQDADYLGHAVAIAPHEGTAAGTGVEPSCDDGHGASPVRDVELMTIEGVPPADALVERGATNTVLIRRGAGIPAGIERLLRPPSCRTADEPVHLTGRWLGILGADGDTEADLEPPYDLELFVERASSARYERAFLTVQVPRSAGAPLTREDVTSSLRESGTISVRSTCGPGGTYLAERVRAFPPG